MEQVMVDDPRGGVQNFGKKPKPSSEWDRLSNKTNTGAARSL
jgi:hypothetical protein